MKIKRKLSNIKRKLSKHLFQFSLKMAVRRGVDVLGATHASLGIGRFQDMKVSGEEYLLTHVLTNVLNKPGSVAFDIGAHQGNYTQMLAEKFPSSQIFSFEPNPSTFKRLNKRVSGYWNVETTLAAVSNRDANAVLYVDSSNPTSSHSTLLKEGQISILKKSSLDEVKVDVLTVDSFCEANQIDSIAFLKIDTEGNELNVLGGAAKLLKAYRISIIQIEFTQLNIETRVFTRDIRKQLPNYEFFRLSENRLIPLGEWNPWQEIFGFQNLLAVVPQLANELSLPGQTTKRTEISRIHRDIAADTQTGAPIKLIVGSAAQHYPGWVSTDYPAFDISDESQWSFFLANRKLSHILAEHVFEHLTEFQLNRALENAFRFLDGGGRFRIAVPDGNHPHEDYIEAVRPGGTGAGADDHKHLFTVEQLSAYGERTGFIVQPQEYWSTSGTLVRNEMNDEDGVIVRSFENDQRNADNKPNYTSLIVDFVKPTPNRQKMTA